MSIDTFLVVIKTPTSEQVVTKVTNEAEWIEDYNLIFNKLNQQNRYINTIDSVKKTMVIQEVIDVTKKGWIFNSTEQQMITIYTLHLIKIFEDLNLTTEKKFVHTDSQTDDTYVTFATQTNTLECILEADESDQPETEETELNFEDGELEPLLDCNYDYNFTSGYSDSYSDYYYDDKFNKYPYYSGSPSPSPSQSSVPKQNYSDCPFVSIDVPTYQPTSQVPFSIQLLDELKDRLYKPKYGLNSNGFNMNLI